MNKAGFFPQYSRPFSSLYKYITSMPTIQEGKNSQKALPSNVQHIQSSKPGQLLKEHSKKLNSSEEQDDEFEPQYHTMKKLRLPINRNRLKRGNWSARENKVYLDFLLSNRASFNSQALRRQNRVFCRLSELLKKKRTPDQCRSHHQKLLAPLNFCLDSLIVKLQRMISSEEKNIDSCPKKRICEIGRSGTLEKEGTGIRNESVVTNRGEVLLQQNEREVSQTIKSDFFKMTLFKNSSVILIEIDQKRILSY